MKIVRGIGVLFTALAWMLGIVVVGLWVYWIVAAETGIVFPGLGLVVSMPVFAVSLLIIQALFALIGYALRRLAHRISEGAPLQQ